MSPRVGGILPLKFAPHVSHVVASDITPAMLRAAEAHITAQGVTNVTFRQAAAEDLPSDDASFDPVTCRIAPHHFEDAGRFVEEAVRVLKPGGVLLVQDHLVPEEPLNARYTPRPSRGCAISATTRCLRRASGARCSQPPG